MVQSQCQYSLSCDSHQSSICSGFSNLQQNGEFVDMTLAADGHFVKVHQVLVALASPYLKHLMTSAPCQHPVIFLNNVSYRNLSLLLEYIYTGEVLVPAENLSSFTEAAKALHVRGLVDITNEDISTHRLGTDTSVEGCSLGEDKNIPISSSCDMEEINLPASARKISMQQGTDGKKRKRETPSTVGIQSNINDYSDMDDSGAQDDEDFNIESDSWAIADLDSSPTVSKPNLLFTVSIRGSLQIILNRYIYNLCATTRQTDVRKWRCVEYRHNKCTAFVVTKGNFVVSRANLHNHTFHDKKILAKIEKKSVFAALDDAQNYNKEEDKEMKSHMAVDDNMVSLEDFPDELKLNSELKNK